MKGYADEIQVAPMPRQAGPDTVLSIPSTLNGGGLATRKGLTRGILILSDVVALCTVVNVLLVASMVSALNLPNIKAVFAAFLLLPFAYTGFGLYRPIALHPEREIFSFFKANTAVIAGLSVPALFAPEFRLDMMLWLVFAAPLLILVVPLFRVLSRSMFSRADWWGSAALVVAHRDYGQQVLLALQRAPELGIRPAALLQNEEIEIDKAAETPIIQGINSYGILAKSCRVQNVVLALDIDDERIFLLEHAGNPVFTGVFVARQHSFGQFSIEEMNHHSAAKTDLLGERAVITGKKWLKRSLDVLGALAALILLAPVFLFISLMIKLTSAGPVFVRQERLGKDGRSFEMYTFRSTDFAREVGFQDILQSGPFIPAGYELPRKFQRGPLTGGICKLLHRYSLDELPQLFNVLIGDMSLVGPRPYLQEELPNMQAMEKHVLESVPGITGLWQISGRHELSFEERIRMDLSYQETWSLSLDYYILLRTLSVVITGHGAG